MKLHLALWVLWALAATPSAWGATGTLTIFDDADENGFDHPSSYWSTGMSIENAIVHSGTTAVYVQVSDFNAASWNGPATYSTLSDYDSISFWFNGGTNGGENVALLLYNSNSSDATIVGKLALADVYGAPLPANTWIYFLIPFSSLPNPNPLEDPTQFANVTIRNYGGSGTSYFFVDDVALIGADIFKSGFD